MTRRIAALTGLTLAGLLPIAPGYAAGKEAKFRITTAWIIYHIEPKQRSVMVRRSYFVTLKADGRIQERVGSQEGNGYPTVNMSSQSQALGQAKGDRAATLWKVVSENTLVRLYGAPFYTFAIWLRMQGDNS